MPTYHGSRTRSSAPHSPLHPPWSFGPPFFVGTKMETTHDAQRRIRHSREGGNPEGRGREMWRGRRLREARGLSPAPGRPATNPTPEPSYRRPADRHPQFSYSGVPAPQFVIPAKAGTHARIPGDNTPIAQPPTIPHRGRSTAVHAISGPPGIRPFTFALTGRRVAQSQSGPTTCSTLGPTGAIGRDSTSTPKANRRVCAPKTRPKPS